MSAAILKIQRAKTWLVINQPFFATLSLGMEIVPTEDVPSMATDGRTVWINEEWVNTLTQDEVIFVLAHEVLHAAFEHCLQMKGKDKEVWNIAADHVINGLLIGDHVGRMPQVGLHDPKLVELGGGTVYGVYDILLQQKRRQEKKGSKDEDAEAGSQQNGKKGSGKPLDELKEPKAADGSGLDESQQKELSAETKVRVLQARNAAKAAGKMSLKLDAQIQELAASTTNWREVLRDFIVTRTKDTYSYARPKRRSLSEDVVLPSRTGEKIGKIAVAVDCSGSVSDELLGGMAAEINLIAEDVGLSECDVIYFDHVVLGVESFTEFPIKLRRKGGGGTDFAPIFKEIEKRQSEILALIVLTDMECDSFGGNIPNYGVFWANYGRTECKAPFGRVVPIRIGKE